MRHEVCSLLSVECRFCLCTFFPFWVILGSWLTIRVGIFSLFPLWYSQYPVWTKFYDFHPLISCLRLAYWGFWSPDLWTILRLSISTPTFACQTSKPESHFRWHSVSPGADNWLHSCSQTAFACPCSGPRCASWPTQTYLHTTKVLPSDPGSPSSTAPILAPDWPVSSICLAVEPDTISAPAPDDVACA